MEIKNCEFKCFEVKQFERGDGTFSLQIISKPIRKEGEVFGSHTSISPKNSKYVNTGRITYGTRAK